MKTLPRTRRPPQRTLPLDPTASARLASLRYMNDDQPGYRRRKRHGTFVYLDEQGHVIRNPAELRRIRALAIPPAWTSVWIAPRDDAHLQATGRDAKGRKQYRYHTRWRAVRDETKYGRVLDFAGALPRIRKQVSDDLARPGLPREKVLATVVRLLETTLIRVGNDEYARTNGSFGLTTMFDRHVEIAASSLHFEFRGKSGIKHRIGLHDRRLAHIVRRCRELPGQVLFQYVDEQGNRHDVGSADINAYLREVSGADFTAKDFRTWAGTVLAALALREFEAFDSQTQAKTNVVRAIENVAERLGNTPSVCRKCYVHPEVIDAYLDGTMLETLRQITEQEIVATLPDLRPEEAAVLALLQQRLARETAGSNGV